MVGLGAGGQEGGGAAKGSEAAVGSWEWVGDAGIGEEASPATEWGPQGGDADGEKEGETGEVKGVQKKGRSQSPGRGSGKPVTVGSAGLSVWQPGGHGWCGGDRSHVTGS